MPIRIAIDVRRVTDYGIGTYIRNLVRALARLDQENEYILTSRLNDVQELSELPPNFKTAIFNRSDLGKLDHLAYPLFLRNFNAGLYHIPLNNVPLFMRRPYVVTVHDMSSLVFDEHRDFGKNIRSSRLRRGLLRASRILTVSAATKHDLETLLGIPGERVRIIYGAPDPRFFEHETLPDMRASQRRILERYQINYPFLLYAGTIRPQKNLDRLVEAFALLRDQLEGHPIYSGLRLIIIGDEISQHPSLRHAVIQARIQNVVRFLGFVPFDTLRVFYETAAVFVFPSLYEGFGLPPLEAMASGTPVVTSNTSSLPEVVGDAAITVNPEKVFEIARGIRDVLLDRDLRARLVEKGFEQARRFSWDRTAREVLDTYLEVAQRG